MKASQLQLPLISSQDFISQGQLFKIELRGSGENYSAIVRDMQSKIVLSDGPRGLYIQKSSGQWLLTSSLVTTVTDPNFRNFGLYQQVLKIYSEKLEKVQKMFLVSENKETLQFSAYLFDSFEDPVKLNELLSWPAVQKMMTSLGISALQVTSDDIKSRNQLRDFMLFLSLQGKSRLRSGLTMEYENEFTGKFWSRRITQADQTRYEAVLKEFESDLIQSSKDSLFKSKLINLLSSSYFSFLQARQNQKSDGVVATPLIPIVRPVQIFKCREVFRKIAN
jgi:hypothetical protein